MTSLSRGLQIILRINLDGTDLGTDNQYNKITDMGAVFDTHIGDYFMFDLRIFHTFSHFLSSKE